MNKIKSGKNVLAYVYIFLNRNKMTCDDFIEDVLGKISLDKDVGYVGFRGKDGLESFLKWVIIGRAKNTEIPEMNIEKSVVSIIKKSLNKCNKIMKNKKKLNIFIFPTIDPFVKEKMHGVSGYCVWKNTIVIFISPEADFKESLEGSIYHEYAHAVMDYYYYKDSTILECLISEGIAEHFRESIMKNGHMPWVKSVSERKARIILQNIKPELRSKSKKLYTEIFFGSKKYPLWSGYAVGYNIVKKCLENSQKTIEQIIFERPDNILKISNFI